MSESSSQITDFQLNPDQTPNSIEFTYQGKYFIVKRGDLVGPNKDLLVTEIGSNEIRVLNADDESLHDTYKPKEFVEFITGKPVSQASPKISQGTTASKSSATYRCGYEGTTTGKPCQRPVSSPDERCYQHQKDPFRCGYEDTTTGHPCRNWVSKKGGRCRLHKTKTINQEEVSPEKERKTNPGCWLFMGERELKERLRAGNGCATTISLVGVLLSICAVILVL